MAAGWLVVSEIDYAMAAICIFADCVWLPNSPHFERHPLLKFLPVCISSCTPHASSVAKQLASRLWTFLDRPTVSHPLHHVLELLSILLRFIEFVEAEPLAVEHAKDVTSLVLQVADAVGIAFNRRPHDRRSVPPSLAMYKPLVIVTANVNENVKHDLRKLCLTCHTTNSLLMATVFFVSDRRGWVLLEINSQVYVAPVMWIATRFLDLIREPLPVFNTSRSFFCYIRESLLFIWVFFLFVFIPCF